MASNLSLAGSGGNPGIFECPNCRQTIDVTSSQCRFCSTAVDPEAAAMAAEKMAKINRGCSDASFLRTAAISIFAFIGIMFIPFMGLLGLVGYYFLLLAVPFLAIRWWIRFHNIQTDDTDFRRARITLIVISGLILLPWIWTIVSHV